MSILSLLFYVLMEDSDQTPHEEVSDLGLHSLPMTDPFTGFQLTVALVLHLILRESKMINNYYSLKDQSLNICIYNSTCINEYEASLV